MRRNAGGWPGKGVADPDTPPSIFGVTPMVVQSGSMSIWVDADDHAAGHVIHLVTQDQIADLDAAGIAALKPGDTFWSYEEDYKVQNTLVSVGDTEDGKIFSVHRLAEDHIEVGDLIFVRKVDTASLRVGDVISYLEDGVVVTHRIIKIGQKDGKLSFTVKGDANLSKDTEPVAEDKVVGKYGWRIAKMGDFAYFIQKPVGMLLFIGAPLAAFIIYDIFRRQRAANKAGAKTAEADAERAALEAELERLRKLAGESGGEPSADPAAPAAPEQTPEQTPEQADDTPAAGSV